jgi:hypothetical protein
MLCITCTQDLTTVKFYDWIAMFIVCELVTWSNIKNSYIVLRYCVMILYSSEFELVMFICLIHKERQHFKVSLKELAHLPTSIL